VRGKVKIGESGKEVLMVGEGLRLNPPPFSHAYIINPFSPTLALTFSLLYNKVFSPMKNKYIISSRETFSKSRLVFRDNLLQ
jgi:hypothetical protein